MEEGKKESPGAQSLGSTDNTTRTLAGSGNFSRDGASVNGDGAQTVDPLLPPQRPMRAFAHEAVGLGICVLPTVPGEKRPAVRTWEQYQQRLPTPDELAQWFTPAQEGIGVVTGKVSENLEALDFDNHVTFDLFCELAERAGLADLLTRVVNGYCDRSPNGNHLLYRCPAIADNQKLAHAYDRDEAGEPKRSPKGKPLTKTLIETRGEGGFLVIAPSCGRTHPSGKPYVQVSGGLATIATITPEDRDTLLEIARSLNEVFTETPKEKRERAEQKKTGSDRPGDVFNARATWAEILAPHGWVPVYERDGVGHWRRPGKEHGIAATTNYADSGLLYVFSTSTDFDAERGYSKFSAYAWLNHNGDFTKAAADLAGKGNATPDTGTADTRATDEAGKEERPTIRISTDITTVVNAAEDALLTLANGSHLFQRIGQLCVVTHSATPPQWLKRSVGAPSIAPCSPAQLRERMSRAAQWVKWTARSKEWTPALPPEWTVKTLHERGKWNFPVLVDVISSPTLREDGEIISAPGYDRDMGLFLDTQGVIFPPIPPRPTLDEAQRAVAALTEPFADFPFAGLYGMSVALSAILSLVARPAITGCVPLFAVDSTTRGTGKGLLIDVVSTIATGRLAPRWAQTRDEEEDRKSLLTIGLEGDPCVHIDNLTHALGSGPLDSALTAGVIKGRLLGLNKSAEAPMNCVFFASGNNVTFAGDMARRVVPIHLESLLERPEDRDDFQQPRLLDWVRKERPRLVVEALTLLKSYFVAGCPKQSISAYGSFEAWSDLIRAALVWAGCADPCEGRKGIEAASDPGYENLASLLHCWEVCYPNEAITLNRVIGDVGLRSEDPPPNKWRDLSEALAAFDSGYNGKRLDGKRIGNALRTHKGRVIDGLRLIQAGELDHAVQWVVQKV